MWLLTDELSHHLKVCRLSWIYTTHAQYATVVEGLAKASLSVKVCLHIVTLLMTEISYNTAAHFSSWLSSSFVSAHSDLEPRECAKM